MWKFGTYYFPISGENNSQREGIKQASAVYGPSLHGARVESLEYKTGDGTIQYGSPIVLIQFSQMTLGLEIPKGEVWIPNQIRMRFGFNGAVTGAVQMSFSIMSGYFQAQYSDVGQIEWTSNPELFLRRDAAQTQSKSAANNHNAYWRRRSADWLVADEALFSDVWVHGPQYTFVIESSDLGNKQVGSDGIVLSLDVIRVPLGERLLKDLRESSTSDLEIQRLLQAIASCGIPQAPVSALK